MEPDAWRIASLRALQRVVGVSGPHRFLGLSVLLLEFLGSSTEMKKGLSRAQLHFSARYAFQLFGAEVACWKCSSQLGNGHGKSSRLIPKNLADAGESFQTQFGLESLVRISEVFIRRSVGVRISFRLHVACVPHMVLRRADRMLMRFFPIWWNYPHRMQALVWVIDTYVSYLHVAWSRLCLRVFVRAFFSLSLVWLAGCHQQVPHCPTDGHRESASRKR